MHFSGLRPYRACGFSEGHRVFEFSGTSAYRRGAEETFSPDPVAARSDPGALRPGPRNH